VLSEVVRRANARSDQPPDAVLSRLLSLPVYAERRTSLEHPGALDPSLSGVRDHQAAFLWTGSQRAGSAHIWIELKCAQDDRSGVASLAAAFTDRLAAHLPGEASARPSLSVDLEGLSCELPLIVWLTDPRHHPAPGLLGDLARRTIGKRTTRPGRAGWGANRLLDFIASVLFTRLDQLQGPPAVPSTSTYHVHVTNELAFWVHHSRHFEPFKSVCRTPMPVAPLPIISRDDPVGGDALLRARNAAPGNPGIRILRTFHILQKQLGQEPRRLQDRLLLIACGGNPHQGLPRNLQQSVAIGDDPLERLRIAALVASIDLSLALHAGAIVAPKFMLPCPHLWLGPRHLLHERPDQFLHLVCYQVKCVLQPPMAKDRGGVQDDLHLPPLPEPLMRVPEVLTLARILLAALNDRTHPIVQDELGSKQLQHALREELPESVVKGRWSSSMPNTTLQCVSKWAPVLASSSGTRQSAPSSLPQTRGPGEGYRQRRRRKAVSAIARTTRPERMGPDIGNPSPRSKRGSLAPWPQSHRKSPAQRDRGIRNPLPTFRAKGIASRAPSSPVITCNDKPWACSQIYFSASFLGGRILKCRS